VSRRRFEQEHKGYRSVEAELAALAALDIASGARRESRDRERRRPDLFAHALVATGADQFER
jgi:hypothetical protein